nr:acyltransferase [Phocaeicola plebeius]
MNIGNNCIIAMGTVIRDNDGGKHQILDANYINAKPITIGNHVWIGENVMILKGVTIGNGAIIAAGSLVTKDIPPHSLAMGRPAKIVRENIEWKA